MSTHSLYQMKECPSCKNPHSKIEWVTWCSKCGTIVCSRCVHDVHDCQDGYHFGIPGRGTRYFFTAGLRKE